MRVLLTFVLFKHWVWSEFCSGIMMKSDPIWKCVWFKMLWTQFWLRLRLRLISLNQNPKSKPSKAQYQIRKGKGIRTLGCFKILWATHPPTLTSNTKKSRWTARGIFDLVPVECKFGFKSRASYSCQDCRTHSWTWMWNRPGSWCSPWHRRPQY